MVDTDALFNAFATLFVTIDPPGLSAIFLGLTAAATSAQRQQIALRGTLIAIAVLLGFMFIGSSLLNLLGISIAAFRVAGGLLLFYTAFEMVFEMRVERKEETAEKIMSSREIQSLAVFPLAIPLVAGPGAISATILLAADFPLPVERWFLVGALLLVGLILYILLRLADKLNAYLGDTSRIVITRVLGILLAALSIQFIADGVRQLMAA